MSIIYINPFQFAAPAGPVFEPVQNFMDDGATNAVGGVVPLTGSNPFWIDIDPLNADLDYSNAGTFNRCMDGSTSTYVYWTGNEYSNRGNVLRARLELVPRIISQGALTSLRIYAYTVLGNYIPYSARLLDSAKNVITGTDAVFTQGPGSWFDIPVTGDPYYLEIFCTTGKSRRLFLYAIEVNGSILVDT